MLKCCGIRQKTTAFICDAPDGYVFQRIDFLTYCKVCKHTIMQVTRVDASSKISWFRRTDEAARLLFDRMRTSILYKVEQPCENLPRHGRFYLFCNEFGRKTKCYSNVSSMLDIGESLSLPEKKIIVNKS